MERRVVRVQASPSAWGMTEGHVYEVKRGLPAGARFIGASNDPSTLFVNMFFEHESFEGIEEAAPVPIFDIVIWSRGIEAPGVGAEARS